MVVVLFGILTIAVLADLVNCRIPNALILIGLACGFIWCIVDICVSSGRSLLMAICYYLLRVFVSFIIFYFMYCIGALGAGDVKLLIVIATFLGVRSSFKILIASLFIGGIYGVLKMLVSCIIANLKNIKMNSGIVITLIAKHITIQVNSCSFEKMLNLIKTYLANGIRDSAFTKIKFSPAIMIATYLVWKGLI